MRVGPTRFVILLATFAIKLPTLRNNPPPLVGLSVLNCLASNLGLDNCKPTCLTMNRGPLGKSVKNFPIRSVSTIEAFAAPTAPPLTKPSSKLPTRFVPGLLILV